MIDRLNILQKFEPITLEEMDGVKLMNRTDTKFTFTLDDFEKAMNEVAEHYKVLEVNGKRLSKYKTLYYDTANLHLYGAHHSGKLNRYKIRHRTYVESDLGFLEVKFKNNKGRTLKKRVSTYNPPVIWEGENELFLTKTQPYQPDTLVPIMWVNYNRCTLVSKTDPERLTIDLDLEFVMDDLTKQMNGLVIAEVKQDKRKSSVFLGVMKKYHIRQGSISKYCLGIATMCSGVKKNNFKRKLITINHLIDHDTAANT